MDVNELRYSPIEIAKARGWEISRVYARIKQREALEILPPRGKWARSGYSYDEVKLIVRSLSLKRGRPLKAPDEDVSSATRIAILKQRLETDGLI